MASDDFLNAAEVHDRPPAVAFDRLVAAA